MKMISRCLIMKRIVAGYLLNILFSLVTQWRIQDCPSRREGGKGGGEMRPVLVKHSEHALEI